MSGGNRGNGQDYGRQLSHTNDASNYRDLTGQRNSSASSNPSSQTSYKSVGSTSSNPQSDSYNKQNEGDPDERTRHVVNELKSIIGQKTPDDRTMDESWIEQAVFKIQQKQKSGAFDLDQWRNRLPSDVRQCTDSQLRHSLVYGNDIEKVEFVLKEKMNKNNSGEPPTDTSLVNIIQPLQELKEKLESKPLPNLFRAVLDIDDNEVDRADRMFYSEAYRLVKNLRDYTVDNAHDQVQAIRLMHYELNDERKLCQFIDKYRTFDEAYTHLGRLAREDATESKPSSTIRDKQGGKGSIVTVVRDDENSYNNKTYNQQSSHDLHNPSSGRNRSPQDGQPPSADRHVTRSATKRSADNGTGYNN